MSIVSKIIKKMTDIFFIMDSVLLREDLWSKVKH